MNVLDENKAGADLSNTALQHLQRQRDFRHVWRTVHSGLVSSHLNRQRDGEYHLHLRDNVRCETYLTFRVCGHVNQHWNLYISGLLGSSYPTCPDIRRSAKRLNMKRYRKTHQHPNLDLGGRRVLSRLTLAFTVGSVLMKASRSEANWYLGAIAGSWIFRGFPDFWGLDMELLLLSCIWRTAAVIGHLLLSLTLCGGISTGVVVKMIR